MFCVLGYWFLSSLTLAQDVPWLVQVNTPPQVTHDGTIGRLEDLLTSDSGTPIRNVRQWEDRRAELRATWQKFLGPMPQFSNQTEIELLRSEYLGDVTRQLIRYECEPEVFVEAYLLIPAKHEGHPADYKPAVKHRAIVALHPTTNVSIDEIAGVSGRDHMHSGLKLARHGFLVICPRCFLWQDATSLNDAVDQHQKRHPNTLGMAKMLYDAMRAVDIIASLPAVDSQRIGAFGHSLGAKEVLYLAAFDDRVRASVASEGGLGYRFTNWNAPWYLGTAIDDPMFPLNHHQLIAMIAPRPLLVLGGESGPGAADGQRSWLLLQPAIPIWRLYSEQVRFGLLNHGEGHYLSPKSFEACLEWLNAYL